MSSALVFLRHRSASAKPARQPLRRSFGSYDVVVNALAPKDVRSLANALAAAAISVAVDEAAGTITAARSRNRIFRLADILTVIEEWRDEDGRRKPSIELIER